LFTTTRQQKAPSLEVSLSSLIWHLHYVMYSLENFRALQQRNSLQMLVYPSTSAAPQRRHIRALFVPSYISMYYVYGQL